MRKLTATTSTRLKVCVGGGMQHAEFAAARAWLESNAVVRTVDRTCQLEDTIFDFLLLACSRRGEFTSDYVEQLRRAAPVARIVALTGSWCDGPWRRACDLLPGVAIVPWHRWPAWAEVNCRQFARRRALSWSLPETASSDEMADFWSVQPLPRDTGLIAIDTSISESAEVLAEVIRTAGYSAVWQSRSGEGFIDGVRAVICDADDASRVVLDRIAHLSRQFASTPIVALINFPRIDDIARIRAAGAAAVVAKPFTLHEILGQLEHALRRQRESRVAAA